MNVFINIFIFIVKKMINEMKFIFTIVYKMNTYEIKKKNIMMSVRSNNIYNKYPQLVN